MTINIEITPTPDFNALAALHAACFAPGWSAADMEALFAIKGTQAFMAGGGFAIIRLVAGEAEILTLAVHPSRQRKGTGLALTRALLKWVRGQGGVALFLEVRESNHAARGLYTKAGFSEMARRERYYGGTEAAIVMRCDIK